MKKTKYPKGDKLGIIQFEISLIFRNPQGAHIQVYKECLMYDNL